MPFDASTSVDRSRAPRAALLLVCVTAAIAACSGQATSAATTLASLTPTTFAATTDVTPSQEPDATAAEESADTSPLAADPCGLLTRDEANKLAGVKVLDPLSAGGTECIWPTPLTGPTGQVQIDVGDGAKKAYDIDNTVLGHDFTAVPGIGDEAWLEEQEIFFRVGDTWVALSVVRLDSPSDLHDMLKELATAIVGRL